MWKQALAAGAGRDVVARIAWLSDEKWFFDTDLGGEGGGTTTSFPDAVPLMLCLRAAMPKPEGGKAQTAITPTRAANYQDWYQEVIKAADLAENSDVRGCMVIKPWGYALWENIQHGLDGMFKATGHVNAYFPLFIPLSFLEKEAAHVEGFAKECAVVTHHRLEATATASSCRIRQRARGAARRAADDARRSSARRSRSGCRAIAICRCSSTSGRTSCAGRCARGCSCAPPSSCGRRATRRTRRSDEAIEETMKMLGVYAEFAEKYMAMPVIQGEKTAGERFPGAVQTFCIEAMMQDRKALQAGTSHFLGQNFARASGIKFPIRTTSSSTRGRRRGACRRG